MRFNFFPSLFITLVGLLLLVDALPRPLNMQGTPSLTPSVSPSVTPFPAPARSFTPSITPSPSASPTPSSTPIASPTSRHNPLTTSSSSTSTSISATATALTAADLNMLSTVTGLLGGLASLMGLA